MTGVSLCLKGPNIVGLIGPNGAGKTTLLNVLTGFLSPDAGRLFLGEREITLVLPHGRVQLGIARTFQDLRLIEQMSVIENVMLACPSQTGEALLPALLWWGVADEEAMIRNDAVHLLGLVGLERNAYELAATLSYGQKKLLTLACCLATKADILLLDEPIAGVHPEVVDTILGLLRVLRNEGKLIVFIEHDIASVRAVADLVVVMDDGRVIAQGLPTEVLELPEIMEAFIA